MYSRKAIKNKAKSVRKECGLQIVGVILLGLVASMIGGLIIGTVAGILGSIVPILSILSLCSIFIGCPMAVGIISYIMKKNRGIDVTKKELFAYFKGKEWLNITFTMFMTGLLYILWSLLIIPAYVKCFSYAMVPYILAEDPNKNWKEVITESRQMMHGNKWHLFVLELSFIGWAILGMFTFNILNLFFTMPYMALACAEFYDYVSGYNNKTKASENIVEDVTEDVICE